MRRHPFSLMILLAVLALAVSGCGVVAGGASYKPPGFPLRVSINTWGEISFSVEGEIEVPTPLGTFSIGAIVDPTRYFNVKKTLIVRYNGEDHFYDLHGKEVDVHFEPGYYKQIDLTTQGDIILLEVATMDVISPPSGAGSGDASIAQPSSGGFSVYSRVRATRPGSAMDADRVTSIWEGLAYVDLQTPGTQTYEQTTSAQRRRWTFVWCGADPANLRDIMQPLTVRFYVNDHALDASLFVEYSTNRKCHAWSTFIEDWKPGEKVKLDIHYHLETAIYDGSSTYPAGDYFQRIYVRVR